MDQRLEVGALNDNIDIFMRKTQNHFNILKNYLKKEFV